MQLRHMKRDMLFAVTTAIGFAASTGGAYAQGLGEPVPEMSVVYYASDIGPEFEQSARALADDWSKLGLDLKLIPVQFSTFISQYIVGGQLEDLAVFAVGADPDRIDPTYWIYDVAACGLRRNGAKWCDEGYSERAGAQRTLLNQDERIEAVHALQQEFVEEMPFFPVVNRVNGIVYNSDKWANVTSPAPVAAHEELVNPWLQAKPLTEDRWLDWAYFEDVSTYNPIVEESAVGWMRFIFDTFAKNNSEGETVPWAAAGWNWTNETTIEVTLRDDMKFHDGEEVTADDAVYTINMIVDLQPPAVSSRTSNIISAEKIDDHSFRINLKKPDAAFEITVLTYMFILPEHIWSAHDGDLLEWDVVADDAVIGSGPFSFQTWRPNEIHELATFKDHWEAADYDGIRRLALGQADAIRAAMSDGTGDIATTVLPVASMSDLAAQNDSIEFIEVPSHGTLYVWGNNEKAPFSDRAFRHAIRTASDKNRVMIEGWQGFATPAAEGPVPSALTQWYNSDIEAIDFDVEAARSILKEAGYGWDSDGQLHFPAN